MPAAVDIPVGTEFGRWTTTGPTFSRRLASGRMQFVRYAPVRCQCSNESEVLVNSLRRGMSTSCGCYNKEVVSKLHNKGGKIENGYRYIYRPDHPNAFKSGYVGEHVVVMSEQLGRPLLPHENVHHKGGDRADNRPEKLELWSTSQPAGQRVEDKVAWAKELLALYEPDALAEHVRSAP